MENSKTGWDFFFFLIGKQREIKNNPCEKEGWLFSPGSVTALGSASAEREPCERDAVRPCRTASESLPLNVKKDAGRDTDNVCFLG